MSHFFSTRSWIVRSNTQTQAQMRLFCFPFAGGGASTYQSWQRYLPEKVEICAVQLPGRENRMREKPYQEITPLVEALKQELNPYLDLPFAFFGHSLGALISFELARHLRRDHQIEPQHLFLSACRAPQFFADIAPLHALPQPALIAELRRLEGTPEDVLQNQDLMRMIVPMLRADFSVFENYLYYPEEPLSCPITAFAGQQDQRAPAEMVAWWREQTTSKFTMHTLPGKHFFINEARESLLALVRADL
ncbi:thioesterase II family protein [Tengunoibacter tsumagoiensis]|uniref:Thioesterase n=1 Tax=Tengunoibacter tsumagoiensis TaxID=2014871 RepID=A0A402A940_9CHLR|nr:alpha/beta fold hydrolase [Tengunoibacter tsumagoiensis]GCE15670.1 thioesterase [Tengunoibacter tsumagoiensis]